MLRETVLRAALTLATVLMAALGAPATHAGVWVGAWDPTYGSPFTNLGWRGSATFDIPATPPCATNGPACTSGSSVLSGVVTFYDVNAPSADIGQITWNAAELSGVSLTSLFFADNTPGSAPTHFETTLFPGKLPTLSPGVDGGDYGNFDDAFFYLAFVIDYCYADCDNDVPALYSGPVLYWGNDNCGWDCIVGMNDLINEDRPVLRVTQVPEPASLALLAAGFLAMGAIWGRRAAS